MTTPIERMIDNAVRCTLCGARPGDCECWVSCGCGWRYQRGRSCRNPSCGVAVQAMRALTLWQPWAWSMACGIKRVENRNWAPPKWLYGHRFALHAGTRWDAASAELLGERLRPDEPAAPARDELEYGAIIATTTLVGLVTTAEEVRAWDPDQERFFLGPYGWLVDDTVLLEEPIACRGLQKLWKLGTDIAKWIPAKAREGAVAGHRITRRLPNLPVIAQVLLEIGEAAHVSRIVQVARGRLPTRSRTPESVVGRDLSLSVRDDPDSLFVRVAPNTFALKPEAKVRLSRRTRSKDV